MSFVLASVILSPFQGLWDVELVKKTQANEVKETTYAQQNLCM
jgi:hypothetical protein